MTTTTAPPAVRTIPLASGQELTFAEYGQNTDSTAVLVLHAGAGPATVAGFAAATSEHAYVIAPTYPGFEGTPRAESTDSVADLAEAYLDLIDILELDHVFVVGNSLGAWVATEIALRDNHGRVSALTLIGATGIEPTWPLEVADPRKEGPVRTGELAYHDPKFRDDPSALTDEQRATFFANASTAVVYGGEKFYDPKLAARQHRVTIPVLVLAGEQDGISPVKYQRAVAAGFPRSTFRTIPQAAHFPHIEQPAAVFAAINDFVQSKVKPDSK
ncbi:alpha/beta hydrolase [Kribbella antibiotica]|uniref:Alpha/beta hydrolase n=1 Tax=Kribbella antibiotica TaxID=190195 RepID=A0A4R4Z6V1_9ACTN|nr:alpha/beta hydrolase [Kribbella antibiotica]TDD53863.1 alpha/beta hydrolase [Kribbella antibiotica]